MKAKRICLVTGCDGIVHGKELCHKHYQQLRKHGEISRITRYDANEIIIDSEVAHVILRDIAAATELHGEFACLNEINDKES